MSKSWIVCLVAVLGVGVGSVAHAAPIAPVLQISKLAPENSDGSKVNTATQNKVAALSKRYVDAVAGNKMDDRANAFGEMKALYATDNKNMALITWLGYAAIQENQYELAAEVLTAGRGKSKNVAVNASNDRNLAIALHNLKRYSEEIEVLRTNYDAIDDEGLALLASAQIGNKDYKGAAGSYAKLRSHRPLDPKELGNYAVSLSNTNDSDASKIVAEAVKADPENASLALVAVNNLVSAGKYDDAIALVDAIDGANSPSVDLRNVYVRALTRRGTATDVTKATAVVDRLGRDAELVSLFELGTAALKNSQFDLAVKSLTGLSDPKAQNNLGRAYEGLNQWDMAAKSYAAASDADLSNKTYSHNASVAYAKANNEAMATRYSERAGEKRSTQFDMARIQGLLGAQKYDDALALMNELESQFTGSAPFYFNKGVIYQKKGDPAKAVECYRKSMAIKEEDATVKNLTIALYQSGDFGGAKIEADHYINRVGRTPEALQNLAAVLAAMNRQEDAVVVWKELLKAQESTSARLDLADALWNSGDTQGARFHYAYVLKSDPGNARAQNGLGLYWLAGSKLKEAESCFRAAINTDPKFATAHYNLGIALERQNRTKEAKVAFQNALDAKRDYSDAKKALERLGG